jgi:large conductance mechanosensitive channel
MNSPIIKEFRNFLLQGDIIALAVAFIMAVAFSSVVTSFTQDIVLAFIAAIFGEPSFGTIDLELGDDGRLYIGRFIDAVINFVLVGAAVFFFIVKPVNLIRARQKTGEEAVPEDEEIVLLREIRDALRTR